MNRFKKICVSLMLMIPLAAPMAMTQLARAGDQQPPPPPPVDQQDRPDGQDGNGPGGPPPMGDEQHRGGPQGRGNRDGNRPGMRQGPMSEMPGMNPFDRMRGFLDLVDRFTRLSHDPVASGVWAVVSAAEILRPRGADAVIDFYNKALSNVKNDAVKRAIRIQLVDLYRQSGQQDKALEQINELLSSVPAGDSSMPPPTPAPR